MCCEFITACVKGDLEKIKYLLLVKPENIYLKNGFIWACENGHLEVVKFLTFLNKNYHYFIDEGGEIVHIIIYEKDE